MIERKKYSHFVKIFIIVPLMVLRIRQIIQLLRLINLKNESMDAYDKTLFEELINQQRKHSELLESQIQLLKEQNRIEEETDNKHKRIFWTNVCLSLLTLGLIFVTFWVGKESLDSDKDLNQTKFAYGIWENFKASAIHDTMLDHWFYYDSNINIDTIEKSKNNLQFRKSISHMLNYFEDLNSLYKKNKIDSEIVLELFGPYLDKLYSKKFIHEYISNKRSRIYGFTKDSSSAARCLDGIYIWKKRLKSLKIENPTDSINKSWEKFYKIDYKKDETLD